MADVMNLVGRVLISLVFFGGFAQKLLDPAPVRGMIEGIGLPADLVWPVAVLNLAGALGLVLGPGGRTVRVWAVVLAAYCVFTSYFHWQLRADPWQVTIVVKNWAIAGGLLILAASGPGRYVVGALSRAG